MESLRADVALVSQGLAWSRAKAAHLIQSGMVKVNGVLITKPSTLVTSDAQFTVNALESENNISRAGGKLELAITDLQQLGYSVEIAGKRCLDIGASTGGFTAVLLENGAGNVIALDVGHGQLRPEIRDNPKVTVMEKTNARYLTKSQLPYEPDVVTCDVSFISLKLIFPTIHDVAAVGAQVLLLIKPQFEVGKGNLGKGGVVRDEKLVAQAIAEVAASAQENGIEVQATIPCRVLGANGNQEYFLFGKVTGDTQF